jgi:hypothetical protein
MSAKRRWGKRVNRADIALLFLVKFVTASSEDWRAAARKLPYSATKIPQTSSRGESFGKSPTLPPQAGLFK